MNITLKSTKDQIKKFSIHQKELRIKTIILYDWKQNELQNFKSREMIFNKKTDQLIFKLLKPLIMETNYILYIKYWGNIRNDAYGLFRFSYDRGKR